MFGFDETHAFEVGQGGNREYLPFAMRAFALRRCSDFNADASSTALK